MYYSITELTNKGVCFVRLSVRPNVKHKHPSRQNRKPHTSQRFCCCLAEVMFLFLESLSLNIFIGDFFTLSYFLANTRNHGLFCHLLYSVKILFKMLEINRLMITLFGQFAIFITHYLSKMLVCPLGFSTRQKDRFEFFRFGEHAVLVRSVPHGSSTQRGRCGVAGGGLGSAAILTRLFPCESQCRSELFTHDAELHM